MRVSARRMSVRAIDPPCVPVITRSAAHDAGSFNARETIGELSNTTCPYNRILTQRILIKRSIILIKAPFPYPIHRTMESIRIGCGYPHRCPCKKLLTCQASPRRFLPLRLCWQTLACPLRVCHRSIPAHINNRVIPFTSWVAVSMPVL